MTSTESLQQAISLTEEPPVSDGDFSKRNRYLVGLADDLDKLDAGLVPGNLVANKDSRVLRLERKAQRTLGKACGNCVLQNSCTLSSNLEAWQRVHPGRRGSSINRPGVEPREYLLRRLRVTPGASCELSLQ